MNTKGRPRGGWQQPNPPPQKPRKERQIEKKESEGGDPGTWEQPNQEKKENNKALEV